MLSGAFYRKSINPQIAAYLRSRVMLEEVFGKAQLNGFQRFSTILHHCQLDDDGAHHNNQEERVVEEVFKHVVFRGF